MAIELDLYQKYQTKLSKLDNIKNYLQNKIYNYNEFQLSKKQNRLIYHALCDLRSGINLDIENVNRDSGKCQNDIDHLNSQVLQLNRNELIQLNDEKIIHYSNDDKINKLVVKKKIFVSRLINYENSLLPLNKKILHYEEKFENFKRILFKEPTSSNIRSLLLDSDLNFSIFKKHHIIQHIVEYIYFIYMIYIFYSLKIFFKLYKYRDTTVKVKIDNFASNHMNGVFKKYGLTPFDSVQSIVIIQQLNPIKSIADESSSILMFAYFNFIFININLFVILKK